MKNLDNENVLTFSFCFLIYGNYYRLTKTYKSISGQPNQILAGPIVQPRKKLSLTPAYRRARGDMIEVYKIVTDIYDPKTTNNLFKIRGKRICF